MNGVLTKVSLACFVGCCWPDSSNVAKWRGVRGARMASRGARRRSACIAMNAAVRVLQSYSAMSLGLLSPSVLYSFAHEVMRSSWYPANECQPLSRRTDGRTAAPIKLRSAAACRQAGAWGPGSELALAHVLPSHAYVGHKIHLERNRRTRT